MGKYCWPRHSWRCPWLSLVFVPGEWRHSRGGDGPPNADCLSVAEYLGAVTTFRGLVFVYVSSVCRGTLPQTSASISLSVLTQCLFRVAQARQNVGITVSAYVLLSTPVRLRACVHRRLCVCIDSNEGF